MPATTLIREATAADFSAINALYEAVDRAHALAEPEVVATPKTTGRSTSFLTSRLSDTSTLFVAEEDGGVSGFASVRIGSPPDIPILRTRGFAYVYDIVVRSERQRRGIGAALTRAIELWSRNLGATRIELVVWEFNRDAASFYEALGFRTDFRRVSLDLNDTGP